MNLKEGAQVPATILSGIKKLMKPKVVLNYKFEAFKVLQIQSVWFSLLWLFTFNFSSCYDINETKFSKNRKNRTQRGKSFQNFECFWNSFPFLFNSGKTMLIEYPPLNERTTVQRFHRPWTIHILFKWIYAESSRWTNVKKREWKRAW